MRSAFIIVISTIIIFATIAYIARPDLLIIDTPISFSEKRTNLTKSYILEHYDLNVSTIDIDPKMIVLHWSEDESLELTFEMFNRETIDQNWSQVTAAGQVNVSAHFLVDKKGAIYRMMPETKMARHVIGLNYHAIGIENIGGADHNDTMTPQQKEANINLVAYLKNKYPKIEYLIGHYEYTQFENHPLWMEKNVSYRTIKDDPSPEFVYAVYQKTKKLGLKRAP